MVERTAEELQILAEIENELRSTDRVCARCHLVKFLSHSAGKGITRRSREVILLIIDNKSAYQVIDGEVKRGKHMISPDTFANETLTYLPEEERTTEKLLEKVRRMDNYIL